MKSLKYFGFVVMLLAIFIASCSKDDKFDVSELNVYAPAGTVAYNIIQGNFNQVGNNIVAGPGLKFPVLITREVDRAIQVKLSIDPSLVRVYDSVNKIAAPSPVLPEGAFQLANNGELQIPAGSILSSDSVKLELKNPALVEADKDYIIPVVINTADNGVPVSKNRNLMFVKSRLKLISAGISSFTNTQLITVILNKAGGTVTGASEVYVKGSLNDKISGSAILTTQANPALLAAYNQQNNTSFVELPASLFNLTKAAVTIPEGAVIGADSIVVKFTDLQAFETGKDYLLPLELVTAKNNSNDLNMVAAQKQVYVHVSVVENNVDANNTPITGTAMAKTGWSVTASGQYSSYVVANIIDGLNNTGWDVPMPAWARLDMGAAATVKGFQIIPNYVYRADNILAMDVFSSNDGTTWKLQGKYAGAATAASSNAANPDYKWVSFIEPVNARYFRFVVTRSSDGSYSGMNELTAFE